MAKPATFPWGKLENSGDFFIAEDYTEKEITPYMRGYLSNYPRGRYCRVSVRKMADGKTRVTRV